MYVKPAKSKHGYSVIAIFILDPTQSASAEDVWAGKNKQTSATPFAEDSTRLYTFSASGDTSLNPNCK